MASFGACLKRQIYLNQGRWKVYPNMSVLLVGPSGLGKDTGINEAIKFMQAMGMVPDCYGKTMERVYENLLEAGNKDFDTPAAGYLIASEITAFLGGKDYQKSMVQELTDLLSTNDALNVSLKSVKDVRVIHKPTVTMFAGSTAEWLHKAMPSGALDGGLFPRFLVVCEDSYDSIQRQVAYPLYSNERTEVVAAEEALNSYYEHARKYLLKFYNRVHDMVPIPSAREEYEAWYRTRMNRFSKAVEPYANRSRDQVHRIAMICAATRGHNYIEKEDYRFAISVMDGVAKKIDDAVRPPTVESQIGKAILKLLPCEHKSLMLVMCKSHTHKQVMEAISMLVQSGQIRRNENGKYFEL
jgi:hypothetical protein